MIRLSASAISSFIDCEKQYEYRITATEQAEAKPYFVVGTLVHKAIEEFWDNEDRAYDYLTKNFSLYNLKKSDEDLSVSCLENFFVHFQSLVSEKDRIEEWFDVPYTKGVKIVGKFDRVLPGNIIIDWKTSYDVPENISDNIQSIIYSESYKKLYNETPHIYLAFLRAGRLVEYIPEQKYIDLLYKEQIPHMLRVIRTGIYPHTGLFRYYKSCNKCVFKDYCFTELEDRYVVESGKSNS